MALCLADSIIQTETFDLFDQSQRYIRWVNEGYFSSTGGCFDIGHQTLTALNQFHRDGKLPEHFLDTSQAGNGSLMRLAPVPIAFHDDLDNAAVFAALSSLPTHSALVCGQVCAVYARLIAGAINGWQKPELFAECARLATEVTHPELKAILAGSILRKTRDQIASSGYVIHTLEAALWAFAQTDDFRSGALLAVNLGDDSDTVGAVYGQLAGAFYGIDQIPDEWRQVVCQGQMIKEMAVRLYRLSGRIGVAPGTEKIMRSMLAHNSF